MFRPRVARVLFCSCLVLAGLTPAAVAAGPSASSGTPKANARRLVRIAEDACARAGQAAQGTLYGRAPRTEAFWMSLDRMRTSLAEVDASLRQRELRFFRALRSGSVALAQLGVVWTRSGVRDSRMDEQIRTLSAAYQQLRNRYGPEWVRFRTGRPLGEEERRRFKRMQAELARLAGTLGPLRDRAAAAGDKAVSEQLALLIGQAQSIATAPMTLDEMLDASVLSDTIRGEWYGTRALHPAGGEDWVQADDAVEEIYTDESVGFVFTAELDVETDTDTGAVQSWSYVEEETDLPEEVALAEDDAPQPGEIAPGEVLLFAGPEDAETEDLAAEDGETPLAPPAETAPDEIVEEEILAETAGGELDAPAAEAEIQASVDPEAGEAPAAEGSEDEGAPGEDSADVASAACLDEDPENDEACFAGETALLPSSPPPGQLP